MQKGIRRYIINIYYHVFHQYINNNDDDNDNNIDLITIIKGEAGTV